MLRPFTLEYHSITYGGVFDETGDLLFPIFVDEDKGVMLGISGVIFIPSFPRVH